LDGADLVYFDGRLTEAALVVAKVAREVGIPIMVEAERLRPGLELLMAEADYVVTSGHYPEDWTGEDSIGDAMLATALRLPNVKWMVRGCRS
jgi:Cys-tRNA synthase (O-phospho-L-seryl-tRNA:Cys-tRNA synthase)